MDTDIFSYSARKIREEVTEGFTEGLDTLDSVYRTVKELLVEEHDIGIFPEYCKLSEEDKEIVIISRESEGESLYPCEECGPSNSDCIGYPPRYDLLSQEDKKQVNEWKRYICRLDKKRGITWEDDIL